MVSIPPVGWAIGGTLLLTLIIGVVFFVKNNFFNNKSNTFTFYLYHLSGNRVDVINAVIRFNPDNRKEKQFFFQSNGQSLDVKPPSIYVGKDAIREITFDSEGNFVYLKGTKIDDEKYKLKALQPEEKQITLHRLRENERRNKNSMGRYQAMTLIMAIVLVFLVFTGTIISVVMQTKASKVNVEAARVNKDVMSSANSVANSNKEVAEQLAAIASALTADSNVTRVLS